MFTDTPLLSFSTDLRHRELLAEAEQFRLGRLARAARRAARRTARLSAAESHDRARTARPPTTPARESAPDRRYAVPR